MAEHLLIVDASGFAFRAYYAKSPHYHPDNGTPTGAVEVYLGMMWRFLGRARTDEPTMGVAVFDPPGGNFRHELFPAYKANRPAGRKLELGPQLEIMRPASMLLGLHPVEHGGFEADDVIATLATLARAAGIRVTIASSDKDFAQLVEDGHIEIVDPMQRKRTLEADVEARWGVPPRLVPDIQALCGDAVDGIPGLRGCGQEIAGKLVRTFGDLQGVVDNVEKVRFHGVRAELKRKRDGRTGAEWVKLFHQLTTLRRDVPMKVDFEGFRRPPIFKDDLRAFLTKLGAGARAEAIFGLDPQLLRVVAPLEKMLLPQKGPRGGKRPPAEVDTTWLWWKDELEAPGQTLPEIPQCGFYQRGVMKGQPMVPARIWREAEYDWETDTTTGREILRCEVAGKPRDPLAEWPGLSMKPITEETYHKMMLKHGGRAAPAKVDEKPKSHANPRTKGKSHV